MKKIISAIILTALCIALISCGNDAGVPDGMQDVSSKGVAYSLYIPATWNPSHDVDGGYYSQDDKSGVSVTSYYPELDTPSIAAYWEMCKESYGATYDNFKVIEEANEIVLGGKAAASYVFEGEMAGQTLKYRQIIAVHGDKFYIMTYTSTPENYDLHETELQAIIDNFKFK